VTCRRNQATDGTYTVTVEGRWEAPDAAGLKSVLDAIPQDQARVVLDFRGLSGLCAGWIQLVLAYTRCCREVLRPVTVNMAEEQRGFLATWGLLQSGWEGFFHVG
jgi:hypothetical protein